MGTRSKSKAAAGLLSALLLLALAVGLLAGLRPLYARAQEQGVLFYYYDPFVENIQTANHTLYWRAREQWEGKEFEPSELLLSDANAAVYAARDAGEDFVPGYTGAAGDESGGTNASYGGLDVYAPDAISALDAFNASVKAHADELAGSWGNLFYAVTDDATGKTYTNTEAGLGGFLSDDPAKNGFDAAQWRYVLALRFDAQGNMSYAASYLGEEGQQDFSASIWNTDMQAYGTDAIRRHLDLDVLSYYDLSAPKSVTFVYGVPRVFAASDDISWYIATSQERSFISHAFDPLFAAALALAALLALWFGRRRGSGLGGGWLCRVPLELVLLALGCAVLMNGVPSSAVTSNFDGSIAAMLRDEFSVDLPSAANTMANLLCAGLLFLFLEVTFMSVLALRQGLARDGWLGYLKKRSLAARAVRALLRGAGRVWRAVSGTLGRMWRALTAIDLRDPAEKTLLRLLAVNFAIVTFICCFWLLGIAGTVIYTVVLFFLLRRRANRIQQDYAALLAAARRMAGGDLATPVEGDMGLFDPLKDELNQVRAGFEKAVAAEVRSQNMKTELITNVSHDLKTPLTAIITYVDLLKDPALSAEDRAKYIETLDKKSQRLKRLIEDLFEVSKAATRNVAMHYAEVDLAALLKQVQYELADKTEASGIDFRWQLPEERMPLVLDGQKTCRIFENLVVNITKYGMPGTRAYITLMPQEHGAQVVFKNISATELDFSAEEITDRFVRGDRSRNTEGSGLGLAIAKSFAELQGGTFSITVDGDLFKATVTLPDTNQPEQPETLPLPAAPDADAQSAPQTGGALPAGI